MTVIGEAVALDVRPARLPSRVVAAALDLTIQATLSVGLFLLAQRLLAGFDAAGQFALQLALQLAVLLGYPVVFETVWRGRTPGKAAVGLRVVRDDGGPITFRHAFVRGLVGLLVERPGPLLFLPAVIASLLTDRGKRIGDLLAGTWVQQERVPSVQQAAVVMPPELAGWASLADLSLVGDGLALRLRQFVARAGQLSPAAREQLGGQLAAEVAAATAPPPPSGTPGWAFVVAVLAERRRRAELQLRSRASGGGGWAGGAGGGAPGSAAPRPAPPVAYDPAVGGPVVPRPAARRPAPRPADGFAPPG